MLKRNNAILTASKRAAQRIVSIAHKQYVYARDADLYNRNEYWTLPIPDDSGEWQGDCEDFALLCRALAEKQCIKTRIATMKIMGVGNHAVVVFGGNWIGDCNFDRVYAKQDIELKWKRKVIWKKISGYFKGDTWREIL